MGTRSPADLAADRPVARETPRGLRRAACALAGALAVLGASTAWAEGVDKPEPLANFPTAEVTIDAHGTSQPFRVWIAATEPRRNQGLMYVRSLPAGRGMLFLFDAPQVASFWMMNTYIPLDLLFVRADGRIIRIVENATPKSTATISSMGLVTGVLEFAGGTAAKRGWKPGDRVHHRAFGGT